MLKSKFLCLIISTQFFTLIFASCRVKEAKSNRKKPCQFPFIWKGVKYWGCTTVDGVPKGTPWCSTKVTANFEHDISDSYYGDCKDENNLDCFQTGPKTTTTKTTTSTTTTTTPAVNDDDRFSDPVNHILH